MPPTNANDPFRTTDHEPSAAPGRDITADFAPGSPPLDGATATHLPGQGAKPAGTEPERGPVSVAVPGYKIESVLGRGGMGVVYKALHLSLKRTVALKMVLAGGHAGPRDLARFRIEAEAVARLQHPHIVQVFEVGEADGHPFCALEFVEGGNLASKLDGKPMPAREAAKLVEALARAMQLAHSRNVVHRDLKPANVLLTAEGTPKITDFGLARQMDSDSGETQAGAVMGTPAYMAPEQASGHAHQAGPVADTYALGAILYACLAGRPPFKGKTVVETLDQVRTLEPVPPSRWQASVPLDLETICLKCLRKEPEKRYASAAELADELVRYQHGEPILARPVGRIERTVKWVKRNPVVAGAAVAVVLALAVGTTVSYLKYLDAEEQKGIALQALHKEEQARKDRVLAQVNRLGDAEAAAVPAILADLAANREEVLPRLREMWQNGDTQRKRMRAALALLPVEPETVRDTLADYLLRLDDPAEIVLIRNTLAPHAAALKETLWARVADTKGPPLERFHALIALAAFDARGQGWEKQADVAVARLLSANPLHLGTWVQALRPVRESLLGPLSKEYREAKSAERREFAATVLADYAADKPDVLAQLLLDADPKQYALLFPVLQRYREQAVARMRRELAQRPEGNDLPLPKREEREQLARRQATAAVTLLKMDAPEDAWPLYRHRPDPEVRSQLLWRGGLLGLDPKKLVQRLEVEQDVSAQRALILALGEFNGEQLPESVRRPLVQKLLTRYREHPDPGIHGAIDWLLRHGKEGPVDRSLDWGQRKELERIDRALATKASLVPSGPGGKRWYVNGQGQTLVLVPGPVEFRMGSPPSDPERFENEVLHRRRIPRSYALASRSVTVAEFQRFLKDRPDVEHSFAKRYSPEADGPILAVNWFQAAQYCNWLSEKEGLPESEWCYPKHEAIKDEMRLPADFLKRKGYRLPTEAEWEYACRAGAGTSHSYGSSVELLPRYGWFLGNSQDQAWPVSQKRPNDLGLFDMHGNVWNWMADPGYRYPQGPEARAIIDQEDLYRGDMIYISDSKNSRVLRGGTFINPPAGVRSAQRIYIRPGLGFYNVGFRLARTYR